MASPQKENGYTAIANQILEALGRVRISGECRQVLDVIFRKTYGFQKKQDRISLSQFHLGTGMSTPSICRAIKKLVKMNLIIIIDNWNGNIYRFNKDFETWKPLSKKIITPKIIDKKDNLALTKMIDTKETNTKERYIHPSDDKKMKYQDTHHSDSHEPSVELGTPLFSPLKKKDMMAAINLEEEITTLSSSKDPADRLVAYYWKVKGIIIPTIYSMKRQYGRDIVYARELVGFDTKIIFNAFKEAKKDSEENHYDWKISTVAKKITSLKHD